MGITRMPHFDTERRIELAQLHNRLAELRRTVHTSHTPVQGLQFAVTGPGKGPEDPPAKGWKPFALGSRWGGLDQTTWFRMTATLPAAFKGHPAAAVLRLPDATHVEGNPLAIEGGEALLYVDGVPHHGVDRNHEEILLTRKARGGESFTLMLEACPSTRFHAVHAFTRAETAIHHPEAWGLYWDCRVALEAAEQLPEDSALRRRMIAAIAGVLNGIDPGAAGTAAYYKELDRSRGKLEKALAPHGGSHDLGALTLVGHSHIDTAWLWPLRETRRKVGRTFATVLRLMEQYPEFHFSASQPVLYRFVKTHYPALWKQIKRRVKEGRWEPCGAPWVEQDSNMPGGESLIRQFLYGNRFFEAEFGMRSDTAWLPDAFGYPWSLPQILVKCQMRHFVTTKIDWGMFTAFPYSYFHWQGIDGTRIRTVMPPLNYNGNPVPADCVAQWRGFKQKELVEEVIYPFGWGDGGGGPTAEMIERGKRMADLPGVPRCRFGRTADALDRMRSQAPDDSLPVYNGELYLELHRGCQTTQARVKQQNRRCETALHDAELLGCMALLHGGKYDARSLREAWELVLLNQFHDILPGSSITEVYEDAERDQNAAAALAARARNEALAHILTQVDTRGPGEPVVVFNTLSWERRDIVRARLHMPIERFHVTDPDGKPVPCQRTGTAEILFEASAPSLGYAVYHVAPGAAPAEPSGMLRATPRLIENDYFRVRLDSFGRFISVYDKLYEREVLPEGAKANVLQLFDDRPHAHDAWDIDHNFEDRQWEPERPESIEVIEAGPVRATIRVTRRGGQSLFVQDISMYALLPRIDVRMEVDWRERRTLLKAAFPVDILSPRATYGIQFGAIERPTHRNTLHDRGRFEVPAQHWADLSEGDYGVALLNDCKYGYDVKDNVLRLSLLRSPVDPDPEADQGKHEFTYALYPHPGDWREGVPQQGYELNTPLLAVEDAPIEGPMPPVHGFASVDMDNVIIETVKKAEDGNAVIVRVYEAHGQRGDAAIYFAHTPKSAVECDMMEENESSALLAAKVLHFYMKPFEIKTFKVRF